jgi:hypothetical protein
MNPEMPFLAAGAISLAGGVAKAKGLPSNAMQSVIGTVVLVIVASATANTRIAPLVRAVGLLLLLAATMAAVPAFTKKK